MACRHAVDVSAATRSLLAKQQRRRLHGPDWECFCAVAGAYPSS